MKIYPYCLVSSRVLLPASIPGLDGRPILQQDIGGLTVILSESDAEKVALTRENVLRHDAVVRSVLEHETPLPFRFGHLVTLEQLTSYIESKSESLQARLQQLRGRVEMSVKIIWNRESKLTNSNPESETVPGNTGKGVAFLMSKRAEMQEEEALSLGAEAVAAWLKSEISGFVCEERVVLRPTEKLVLSASFLVDASKLEVYKKRTALIKSGRPELHFLTSGPWPPYSFSNNELEFKTHLGVS
jgi:hypothetical protein